jgi:flavin reductase (DIM6/NTAB) family NADH-FMN oxidoreductase RutF
MRRIAMSDLSRAEAFRLITGGVGPRPVALVTTRNADGGCNAAPFSAFNYVSDDPPILAIGFDTHGEEGHRPGERKDTLVNIERTGAFVVNMVDETLLDAAVACASDFPAGVSETTALGLALAPSSDVDCPRLAQAQIAWECVRHSTMALSATRTLLLGRIVRRACARTCSCPAPRASTPTNGLRSDGLAAPATHEPAIESSGRSRATGKAKMIARVSTGRSSARCRAFAHNPDGNRPPENNAAPPDIRLRVDFGAPGRT